MATLYRIREWDSIYETAETRKLEHLRWVAMPNKHDGLGFRRVCGSRDQCELFAAWILLVQVASKGRKGDRGRLVRDGAPMTAEDISLVTGYPTKIFERALSFFSDPKQGWLVAEQNGAISATTATDGDLQSHGSPVRPASSPGCPADAPAEGKGMERNGIGGKVTCSEAPAPSEPADPVMFVFPVVGAGKVWHLRKTKVDEYRATFPALDVEDQMRRARQWCVDNPRKQKTATGMSKFIFAWLERSQNSNRGASTVGGANRHQQKAPTAADHGKDGFQ